MTNKKILPVFAIVAVAAMMGVSSIAPAYSAQKDTNLHENGEFFITIAGNPCGSGLVGVTFEFNVFLFEWSNDRFKLHESAQLNLYKPGPTLVGTVPIAVLNAQGNTSDGPTSHQLNIGGEGKCTNGDTFPVSEGFHCGATVQRDSSTIAHNVECIS